MKKVIYLLILSLVIVSGLVFANRRINNGPSKKAAPKLLTAAEREAEMKKWEASPEGIKYANWVASPAGKKVFASYDKIKKNLNDYTDMEVVVTSLSLPPGSRLGFGVMARINGDDYIVRFDGENAQLEQLHSLKVNDKIIIKSHYASNAPKYSYLIITCGYAERDGKVFFQRVLHKGGC